MSACLLAVHIVPAIEPAVHTVSQYGPLLIGRATRVRQCHTHKLLPWLLIVQDIAL